MKKLAEQGTDLRIKTPVLLNVNADETELIAEYVRQFNPSTIALLPYHPLGEGKYTTLQTE